jgi:hypothetical protein
MRTPHQPADKLQCTHGIDVGDKMLYASHLPELVAFSTLSSFFGGLLFSGFRL